MDIFGGQVELPTFWTWVTISTIITRATIYTIITRITYIEMSGGRMWKEQHTSHWSVWKLFFSYLLGLDHQVHPEVLKRKWMWETIVCI